MNTFNKNLIYVRWTAIVNRFLLIFLPLALFIGSLTLLFYYKDVKSDRTTIRKSEQIKINAQEKVVGSKFRSIITDLQFLVLQTELQEYLQDMTPVRRTNLARELLAFTEIKKIYSRVEFLDREGKEVILINNIKDNTLIVPNDQLQNRAGQSYFQKSSRLPKDIVLVSPFTSDLDRSGKDPLGPVIRFSIPVLDSKNTHHGVFVLNYPTSHLIEDLTTVSINSPGQTLLVHPSGFYLNKLDEQSSVTGSETYQTMKITSILPQEWKEVKTHDHGQFISPNGLITFKTISPHLIELDRGKLNSTISFKGKEEFLWKTISYVPQQVLKAWPDKVLGRILLLYTLCLIIIGICSFLLARTSVRRKKAEEAMRQNEEELRAINTAAANAIIVIDNNKNVLHWNPAAQRLFQYTATEVVDMPITSIISPPRHQSTFTKISRKFIMPDPDSMEAKTIELFGYKKDGTEFPVEVSFSAFKSGEQWHTVGIIRDISTRKEMEKEVLRTQKFESLGALSSGIAHDFNNLLTAIIGNINLVGKLSGTSTDSLTLLQNAEKAARRAKALTQQLLTFSKGGMPIRKTTAIDSLIKDSVEFALHGTPIVNSCNIPENLYLVDIDVAQIGQVIQNIVNNSRQAISGSGVIDIRCKNVKSSEEPNLPPQMKGNYIVIEIRDTGHGIAKRHMPAIFDPYFTTKDHGSGLGLTTAYSIIQRHDGHISISSEEDRGTVVSVYLPAAVDQYVPSEKEKRRDSDNHFKIMVIDDEEMLLNIAGRMLVHLGHECVCARSAREALDLYKHMWKTGSPVDGVIVDLTLPGGMGGKETAGAIFDINSEARIIVSSGYSNNPVMVDFDEYGFCAAIAKPFDMNELSEVIDSVLE